MNKKLIFRQKSGHTRLLPESTSAWGCPQNEKPPHDNFAIFGALVSEIGHSPRVATKAYRFECNHKRSKPT